MPEIFITHGHLELIHPDGHTVTQGPAEVRAGETRIEVVPERGREYLIDYVTLGEIELVNDTVPLVLESGYTIRLSDLGDAEELLRRALCGRSGQLVPKLLLPGRTALVTVRGELSWSEKGWAPLHDDAHLLLTETHLLLVPDRHRPLCVPVGSISDATQGPRGVGVECRTAGLQLGFAPLDMPADELREGLLSARDSVRRLLRDALPVRCAHLAAHLATGATLCQTSESEMWPGLVESLVCEDRREPLQLLDGLTRRGGMRLGLSAGEGAGVVAWCLASVVSRGGSEGSTVAMVVSEPATCSIGFRTPPVGSEPDRTDAALMAIANACGILAPDLEPLGLRETEMAEYLQGQWLWPMHHLEALRTARRRFRWLLPHADSEEWSRDLLQLLAQG